MDEPRLSTHDASRAAQMARNLRLLSAFRALQMTLFPVAVVPLYWQDELGLTMTEIFLVQALFGLFAGVLEFPGGVLADRIGYCRAMRLSTIASSVGWVVLGVAPDFWTVVAGELMLACSLALSSGTDAALMYESLLERDEEEAFTRWFGRSRSLGAAAEGSAALFAGLLLTIWPPLPFFVQAGVSASNFAITLFLVEPARPADHELQGLDRIRSVVHLAAVASPRLRASIAAVAALGFATFIPVWMMAVYAEQAGVPVAWIGLVWAIANYVVALGHFLSDRTALALGTIASLLLCTALIGLGLLGLGLSTATFGFLFYYAICLARGLNGPLLSHVQQRLIPSSDRASLLSINSLIFRLLFFALGPLLGWGMDTHGAHRVLLASAAVMIPVCGASVLWLRGSLRRPGDA